MDRKNGREKIMITECYSSSVNYIHDIRELGYEPVLLELYLPGKDADENSEEYKKWRDNREINDKAYALNGDELPEIIMACERYEDTLEKVRQISPILILPGDDMGILMAIRLSEDLGLKTNKMEAFPGMRSKLVMQEKLRAAGIAHIPTCAVDTYDAAVAAFRSWGNEPVVIKPTEASGSAGVFICRTEEEIARAFRLERHLLERRSKDGELIIIQQFKEGQELALDTITCDGKHVALYGWKYSKRLCPGHGTIYDRQIYFSPSDEEYTELIEYVFSVLTELGIKYGAVHTEVVITGEGPVLMEVNCRPGGGFQKYDFQDKVMQIHETMASLHSYLMAPDEFLKKYPVRMKLRQPAASKDIVLEKDIFVEKVRIAEAMRHLPAFEYVIDHGENCLYPKTIDQSTCGGVIYFTDEDVSEVERALEYIGHLEKERLDLLYDIR